MPWRIDPSDETCVQVEKDGGWRKLKCHASASKATAHLRALNANVDKACAIAKVDEDERLVFGWASVAKDASPLPLGWWVGFKVLDDEVWKGVKDGTYSMFSIRGSGTRSPLDDSGGFLEDSQGDVLDLESLEKSAYDAVLSGLIGDEMHTRDLPNVRVVESFVVTPEKLEAMEIG